MTRDQGDGFRNEPIFRLFFVFQFENEPPVGLAVQPEIESVRTGDSDLGLKTEENVGQVQQMIGAIPSQADVNHQADWEDNEESERQ